MKKLLPIFFVLTSAVSLHGADNNQDNNASKERYRAFCRGNVSFLKQTFVVDERVNGGNGLWKRCETWRMRDGQIGLDEAADNKAADNQAKLNYYAESAILNFDAFDELPAPALAEIFASLKKTNEAIENRQTALIKSAQKGAIVSLAGLVTIFPVSLFFGEKETPMVAILGGAVAVGGTICANFHLEDYRDRSKNMRKVRAAQKIVSDKLTELVLEAGKNEEE